jgi:putative aldouronate transport system permease protein
MVATALGRRSALGMAFDTCNYALLLVLSLSIIYPFWNLFLTSFSRVEEVTSLGMHLWIDRWTVSSWGFVLQENDVLQAYLNTIHRVVFGTLTTLLVTFSAGYALAKRDLPGRGTITTLFIFTLWFGGGLIPTYLLIRSLGMINTRWVLIIPVALNVYYIVIARNFMMTIDQSLEDSAIIDGAGYWTILFRIVLPVSKPVLATIALWAAVSHWNAWFDALIYINDADKRVLQMLVRDMIQLVTFDELLDYVEDLPVKEHIPPQSVRAVTILITIGPIVMVYPFIQKYFVKGVMLGSLKG